MKKTFFATLALALFVSACGMDYVSYEKSNSYEKHFLMTVRNTHDFDAVLFIPEHGDVDCGEVTGELPDTLTQYLRSTLVPIDARSSVLLYVDNSGNVSPIETYHPEDKVPFYLFDSRVLADSTWKSVVKNKLWIKRVDVSVDDILSSDKTLAM